MSWLLVQLLWFSLAASIIVVDRQLMSQRPVDPDLDNVDLRDRSVSSFLIFMVIFGGLIIPFYLWYSRRTGTAVVVGIGLAFVCGLIVRQFIAMLG